MSAPFNLVDEPWVRARLRNGEHCELSLRELFARSDSVERISGEIPSQDVAILRLLIAILSRALDAPETLDEWADAAENPEATRAAVNSYLDLVHDRFDLRDAVAPFYQVAGLTTAKGEPSSLDVIIADVPNGSKFFTTRLGEANERMSWSEAARWLVHAHAFDPSGIRSGAVGDPRVKGGKGYPVGTGWAGQLGIVVIERESLFDTLMSNLVVPEVGNDIALPAEGADLAPWERDPLGPGVEGVDERSPRGPVDCLTWPSRRLRLVGDDEGVTGVFLCQGDKLTPQNRTAVEPMTPWRFSDPQTKKFRVPVYMPRKHQEDRAFWRGIGGVLYEEPTRARGREIPQWRLPATVAFQRHLMAEGVIPREGLLAVSAVGVSYGPQEATMAEVVNDRLVFPRELLDPEKPGVASTVMDAIHTADAVAGDLRNLAANLVRSEGSGEVDGARARASVAYYADVDRPFREWLVSLEGGVEGASRAWHQTIRSIAEHHAATMISSASPAAFKGRVDGNRRFDAGISEVWFRAGLRRTLPHAYQQEADDSSSNEENK